MRILIYGLNFAPELTGIGKYTGEMAVFLAEKGHEVRVITAPPYYPQWRLAPGYSGFRYKKEMWRGATVYRCPLWVPARLNGPRRILHLASFALSSLPVALAQIHWRPEQVIAVAPAIISAPTAAAVARLVGGKSWLHIQDFELDAALRLGMLPGLDPLFRLAQIAEGALYRRFDCVSTISNRMLEHLKRKGVSADRTILFPNWVDTCQIIPILGHNGLRQELEIKDDCQVILYSGAMGQKQGLDVVVKAARLLASEKELLFLLCGEGNARLHLETLANGLPNVYFLPLQPVERLNELLNLASIHILPQSSGAADLVMPSKLSGILASGRPVIVTARSGTELANVMEPLGRVIPPEDPESLAESILDLACHPNMRIELGWRGRAYVERTWAKQVVLEGFLKSLLSQ
jgi:colanic acid biosynthesis glycosyl transferase WcaI